MKKLIIIFILSLYSLTNYAQVPGYLGKKFSVILSPTIGLPHLSNVYGESKVKPSFSFATNFEWIFSKHVGVGFRYKLGYNNSLNNPKYSYLRNFKENNTFLSHTLGFFFKMYPKRQLAPMGGYFKVGFSAQALTRSNVVIENSSASNATIENQLFFDAFFHMGGGRNWIVGDFLLLGFEVEAALPFVSQYYNILGISSSRDELEDVVAYRTNFATEVFKVSLNIGFLAF